MTDNVQPATGKMAGFLLAFCAYGIWSAYPILWSTLADGGVRSTEVLAHRVIWAGVFGMVAFAVTERTSASPARRPQVWAWCFASGLLININWLVSIWSAATGHVVDSSLGFFLAPLTSAVFGVVFFKDDLTRLQYVALGIVALGIVLACQGSNHFPWIAISLALTSAGYIAIRKHAAVGALAGLCIETAMCAPVAFAYLWYLHRQDHAMFAASARISALVVLAGVLTALALVSYVGAARRLQLSTLGLMQYIHPSVQFALGTLFYREPVSREHRVILGCILSALILYTASGFYRSATLRKGTRFCQRPA